MLVVMGIGCALCGCSKKQEEIVEITMIHGWGSIRSDHIAMRQIYEDFEKEHPWIHVNLISMPSSADVVDKVGDLLTVGELPDIIFTGGEGRESIYSFMVEKGYAVDIMPYILEDSEFTDNVSPFILETWMTENKNLYTVSDVLLMGGYWYNQELLKEAGVEQVPSTWEQWFEMCEKVEKLNEQRCTPVKTMVLDTNHVAYLITALLSNGGAGEIGSMNAEKINPDTLAFENALGNLEKISEYVRLEADYNYLDTLSCFNKGETVVYINGVWANVMIDKDLPVAYAAFPSEDGKGVATRSACVGYILGNTGDEKRIAASVEFLKYMLSDSVAERILKFTGQVPSNPNIELTDTNSSPRMKQAVTCVECAGMIVETPENLWKLYSKEEYERNIILYLKGNITKEELRKKMSKM